MNTMKRAALLLTVAMMHLAVGATNAETVSPLRFQHGGTITQMERGSLAIRLDEQTLYLAGSVKVYSAAGQEASRAKLKAGTRIRYNVDEKRSNTITEIMIMPGL